MLAENLTADQIQDLLLVAENDRRGARIRPRHVGQWQTLAGLHLIAVHPDCGGATCTPDGCDAVDEIRRAGRAA